jgi:hypothetical protein
VVEQVAQELGAVVKVVLLGKGAINEEKESKEKEKVDTKET